MITLGSFQLSLTKFTYSVILLIFIRYGLAGLSYWFGSKYVHLNVISLLYF